jgi:hypothetical protein
MCTWEPMAAIMQGRALKQMGVKVLDDIDDYFATEISLWLNSPSLKVKQDANKVDETLRYLVDNYPAGS